VLVPFWDLGWKEQWGLWKEFIGFGFYRQKKESSENRKISTVRGQFGFIQG